MTTERRYRLIRIARKAGDLAAVAILEGDRRFTPEPETFPLVRRYWAGLTWSSEKAWHAA